MNNPLFEIVLPWPPSVNHMYRPGGRGRRVLTKQAMLFRETVSALVLDRSNRTKAELPIVGAIAIEAIACPPDDSRRRDLDNTLKATLDALQHARAFCDDAQVGQITIRWGWTVNDGSMRVSIGRIEGNEAINVEVSSVGTNQRRPLEDPQTKRRTSRRNSKIDIERG